MIDGKKSELGIFVRVTQAQEDTIRYAAVGRMDKGGLTGIVYGYVGGGEHDMNYVINGKELRDKDSQGEYIDYDEREKVLSDHTASTFVSECWTLLDTYTIEHGDDTWRSATDKLWDLPCEEEVVYTWGKPVTPVDFGNTFWPKNIEKGRMMATYTYKCSNERCWEYNKRIDIQKPMAESSIKEFCKECKLELGRVYNPVITKTGDGFKK